MGQVGQVLSQGLEGVGTYLTYCPFNELSDKIQLIQKNDPSYKEMILDEITQTFLRFYLLKKYQSKERTKVHDFDEVIPNIIYICEKYENFLFPQLIFNLVEKSIDKSEIKSYYQQKYKELGESENKEEIMKRCELFEKIPKGIITNIHKLYLNIFEICFILLETCLNEKEAANKILNDSLEKEPKPKVEDNKNYERINF